MAKISAVALTRERDRRTAIKMVGAILVIYTVLCAAFIVGLCISAKGDE